MNGTLSIPRTVARERRRWSRRLPVRILQFTLDLWMLAAAFVFAYLLRFEFQIPAREWSDITHQLPYAVIIQFGIFALVGVYSFIWRYVGMPELRSFLRAALTSALLLLALRLFLPPSQQVWRIPISVIVIDAVLGFGFLFGMRVLRRALYERQERERRQVNGNNVDRKPVLLVGAGVAGVLAAREILNRGDMQLVVKGFVDDDARKQGA